MKNGPYTADFDGWPLVFFDAEGHMVCYVRCFEQSGAPHLPLVEAYAFAGALLALLNGETAP